jgi:tetratricopeptide (TPR) repeat protein
LLQQTDRVAITAISGMGGIGKTELALQYAHSHHEQRSYLGGVCWLRATEPDIGTQLVNFARVQLQLEPPDGLDLMQQVAFCWRQWRDGDVLIVLDDVSDYQTIAPFLPPADRRFKVLITTRRQLGRSVQSLEIQVLTEAAALELLQELAGAARIQSELQGTKSLCAWLGYLPLGLELVGRFLARKPDWSIAKMQQELIKKRLAARALCRPEPDMTASHESLAAAFELSWQDLTPDAQLLSYLLSLFAPAPIPWLLVEPCFPDSDPDDLEDLRDNILVARSLLQRVADHTYQLHQLIREFFQTKLQQEADRHPDSIDELKRSVVQTLIAIAQEFPQTPIRTQILTVTPVVPHWIEVVTNLEPWISNEDLIWPYLGLGRFYEGQGSYMEAEPWLTQCLAATGDRLGEHHPDVASSLNNLAGLYQSQGRYGEAEPLYVRSLSIYEQQLGEHHPDVATSLNNLAGLYYSQGRYGEAEPLYVRSLSICEQQLGEHHPDVASSLNNLAGLYYSQGRYSEAEPLYVRSLSICEQQLGEHHPDVASSLNNLARLYESQERYHEAESLYLQALQIDRRLLGENHPNTAIDYSNLAGLYKSQQRYPEAENLYLRALSVFYDRLGPDHPHFKTTWKRFVDLVAQLVQAGQAQVLSEHPITQDLLREMGGDE